jgi:transcriptional regulator with XRE-family HTH domain
MTLASYLAAKGLTDAQFAAMVGVSGELVRLWRHGRRAVSARRASAVSELTGIPLHELRPDVFKPPAKPTPKRPRAPPPAPSAPTPAAAAPRGKRRRAAPKRARVDPAEAAD